MFFYNAKHCAISLGIRREQLATTANVVGQRVKPDLSQPKTIAVATIPRQESPPKVSECSVGARAADRENSFQPVVTAVGEKRIDPRYLVQRGKRASVQVIGA